MDQIEKCLAIDVGLLLDHFGVDSKLGKLLAFWSAHRVSASMEMIVKDVSALDKEINMATTLMLITPHDSPFIDTLMGGLRDASLLCGVVWLGFHWDIIKRAIWRMERLNADEAMAFVAAYHHMFKVRAMGAVRIRNRATLTALLMADNNAIVKSLISARLKQLDDSMLPQDLSYYLKQQDRDHSIVDLLKEVSRP